MLFAGTACLINVGGPTPPAEFIPTSPDSADELTDTWDSALSLELEEIRLVITEQQLTSFLAQRIEDSDEPLLTRPQVFLREGEIRVYGTAGVGPFEAGALLSIQPSIDSNGDISFEVTSAEFGPVPAPEALTDGLSGLLTEAFTGKLGSLATGIRITSFAIAGGEVAIVGELR